MATRKTHFLIGLFMIGGLLIGLVALIALGMSNFFEEGRYFATYFDQSVQGLDVDSPVKYRGVAVGRVDRIAVASDSKLIKVILKIDSGMKLENDMIAQLSVVGITGSMFIELDRRKPGEKDQTPVLNFPSEYPIVASKPSEISKLFSDIDEIIQQFNKMDLPGISDHIKETLASLTRTVDDFDTRGVSGRLQVAINNLNQDLAPERWDALLTRADEAIIAIDKAMISVERSFNGVDKAIGRFDKLVGDNEDNISAAVTDLRQTLQAMDATIKEVGQLADRTGGNFNDLTRQFTSVLTNLETASEKLTLAIDQLATQPSQILYSSPPPRRGE